MALNSTVHFSSCLASKPNTGASTPHSGPLSNGICGRTDHEVDRTAHKAPVHNHFLQSYYPVPSTKSRIQRTSLSTKLTFAILCSQSSRISFVPDSKHQTMSSGEDTCSHSIFGLLKCEYCYETYVGYKLEFINHQNPKSLNWGLDALKSVVKAFTCA